jgi:quinohemoprotein ethanol dehydrogenase
MRKLVFLAVTAALVAATVVALASASSTSPKITPSAETANAYLPKGVKPCVNDWLYFGCDAAGTAYSQLKQITKANVTKLKVVWDQGYMPPAYSQPVHAQPICCANNMMYTTGADSLLALEPDTGKIIWKYQGVKYDTTTAAGAASTKYNIAARNIAYSDKLNLLYTGEQDGHVTAINAKTGTPQWNVAVVGAGNGTYGAATSAQSVPFTFYADDGKDGVVLSAPNGGESPMRGSLSAFNAKTGKLIWRAWMTPDPTQIPAILTWANPAEAAVGGAPVWSIPTYDPINRNIVQGTGNTYPYLGRAPGKNLWATAYVAFNIDTGALKWYVQPIHHDEWDYDCPHSANQFNAIVHGKLTHVMAFACKNSYAYYVDPKNGHCIFGCPEVSMSTRPGYTKEGEQLNNTYPTQMIPVGAQGQLIQHCPDAEFAKEQFPYFPTAPDGKNIVLSCDMVPENANFWILKPFYTSNGVGVQSRATYNPALNMQVWTATNSIGIYRNVSPTDYHTSITSSGRVSFTGRTGYVTAINLNDNTVAWQYKTMATEGNAYGGTMSTATGLLFFTVKGRTDGAGTGRQPDYTQYRLNGVNPGGKLYAFDMKTGQKLWEFQNPHADLIEGPPITFMYKGKQYISLYMMCPNGTGKQGPFDLCPSHDRLMTFSL